MGSTGLTAPLSPTRLPDRNPTLLFLCPRPRIWGGGSRLARFADRGAERLLPAPLLVAEVGGYFAVLGSLPADIDGEGDDAEDLMPFVWMPGGTGRLILEGTDWVIAPAGAISTF